MDRVGPRPTRRLEDALGVQVALAGGGGADLDGRVGVAHVQGAAIGL